MSSAADGVPTVRILPYLRLARPDHWFKNAFMLLGVMLAAFYRPQAVTVRGLLMLLAAVAITCAVASSNYVLNEFLDAEHDRQHPEKQNRPAAMGQVQGWVALLFWGALGLGGILCAFALNGPFGASAFALWVMGCLYNIPPVRTKEVAYLDVLSESVNNPLRLHLGWFALVPDRLPPLSLSLSYWMVGAFFMAAKRFAEYRSIGDPARAARYRRSFAHYDEARLLASMAAYLSAAGLFAGIFVVRYHLELVLAAPLVGGFFAWYMALAMRPHSPVQHPERLHQERGLLTYGFLTVLAMSWLMWTDIPALYEWFSVEPLGVDPLWRVGR